MPANFPSSPTLNQIYQYNNLSWKWDGSSWEAYNIDGGSGGVAQVYDVASTSTGYFDLPSGNTAQRPTTPNTGMIRYNSTTGFAEVYNSVGWGAFGAQPPVISSVSPASFNGESNTEFTVNGFNFTVDATVKFIDNAGTEYTAALVSFIDSTTLRARTPQDFTVAQEPLDVKVSQASGQVTKVDCIDCGGVPTWSTAAGSLGTQDMNTAVSIQLVAIDPDAGATITYSVTSGSLPSGVTLNSSTGLLSGTAPTVLGDTTYNFTITATDNAGNQSSTRAFSFTVIAVDPYWTQVVMLLHGDGSNGSTTIVDSSTTGRTFTIIGSTAISTSIKKFGTGSIAVLGGGNTASFYQNGGTITIPAAFTMEAYVYLLNSGRHVLLGEPSGQAYSTAWGFAILDTIGPYGQTGPIKGISWILSPITGYGGNVVWSGQYPTLNTWTHIAVCRNASGNWSFYMDGIKGTTQNSNSQAHGYSNFPTNDGPTGSMTIPVYTGNFDGLTSGGNSAHMPASFNGYIDEFRVTIGTARYSSNFTPPSGPFPNR
jgi:hypothetical protein